MRKRVVYGAALIGIGIFMGVMFQPLVSGDSVLNQLKKIDYVLNMALKNYVDDVDSQKLTEAAIRGMLEELDPHSVYISAEEMKKVDEDFSGSFEGIGVQFDIMNDTITVIAPISGGPSEKVGVMAGDKIVIIDGVNAIGVSRDSVPKMLKGPKGTKVVLDVKRNGISDLIHFDVTRDVIPLYTVDAAFMIDKTDIGVIVVNRFAATTNSEMMQAAKELTAQGMKKLILDLRHNPGGYLNEAEKMADEFITGGDTIVFTKGRRPEFDDVYMSRSGNELEKVPLIVMINAGSASASEIVSGAIQDLDRGLIVGETSFGKGLVQRQYPIGDGSAFRLTIAKYYTPSGRCIQRPYKDKDDYRKLFGRLELEEGSNIEHAFDKVKKEMEKENKELVAKGKKPIDINAIPVYHTAAGRAVLGGGGVTPDYIVKQDTITRLSIEIRAKRIFYEFVANNLNNGKDLKSKYPNFTEFYRDFNVTDNMMKDFRKLAENKGIKWNDDHFKADDDYLRNQIKSDLARVLWDRNKSAQVFGDIDRQLQKAITLFPEAIKVAKKGK